MQVELSKGNQNEDYKSFQKVFQKGTWAKRQIISDKPEDIQYFEIYTLTPKDVKILLKFCTNLKILNIQGRISIPTLEKISTIKTLKKLTFKIDNINFLSTLSLFQHLQELQIQQYYSQLPLIIQKLPQLQYFTLIKEFNENTLFNLLKLKYLTKLQLRQCSIKNFNDLSSFKCLTYLALIKCNVTNDDFKIVVNSINLLKTLWIGENLITDQGIQHLIEYQSSLEELSLQWNNIGEKGFDFIAKNMKRIKRFSMSYDQVSNFALDILTKTLPNLQHFHIYKDVQPTQQVNQKSIIQFIKSKKYLKLLNLCNSGFKIEYLNSDRLVQCISSSLSLISQLYLYSQQKITNTGCFYISKMKFLPNIGLQKNLIGDVGAYKIVKNCRHSILNLSYNHQISVKAKKNMKIIKWQSLIGSK